MTLALDRAREIGAREAGLAVVVTTRDDGTAQASVVNAGFLEHPLSGKPIVAFVVRGHARKLVNLRRRPQATVVFRSGWDWATIEGTTQLVGPDDALDGVAVDRLPHLLRSIYAAAVGGTAEDWMELDRKMAEERHTAVLVSPTRAYSSPD